jgi:hypothetical protein
VKGKLWRSLLGGVALVTAATGIASAQSGLPSTGWYTTATIQNLSETNNADVVLSAYDAVNVSQAALTAQTSIAPGANVVFRPDSPGTAGTIGIDGLNNNFFGSMVISSLENLAAVAKVTNQPLGSLGVQGGTAAAEYQGSSEGSSTLIYPSVKQRFNGQTSVFYIQSVGGDGTFTATVQTADDKSYSKSYSVTANKTTVILVGQLQQNGTGAAWSTVGPCTGAFSSPGGAPCFGALTVESTTPVVGTSVSYDSVNTPAAIANSSALLTPGDGATQLFCPLYKSRFPGGQPGRNFSGVQIQNITGAAITATVTLRGNALPATNPARGKSYTVSFPSIAAGKAVVVSRGAGQGGFDEGGVGSVEIVSSGNIVAVTNEDSNPAAGQATSASYNCFSAADGTAKVSFPAAKRDFPSATSALANNSGVIIQNISSSNQTANVQANYVCRGGATISLPTTLAPGSSVTFAKFGFPTIPANSLCAVTVTATDSADASQGVPLVGIANEDVSGLTVAPAGTVTFRDASNYEGFNQ